MPRCGVWHTAKPKEQLDEHSPKEAPGKGHEAVLLKDQLDSWQNGVYTIQPRSPFEITRVANNRFVSVASKKFHEPIGDLGAFEFSEVLRTNSTLTCLALVTY
jgi:hypothetical protein